MLFKPEFNLVEDLRKRGMIHDAFPGTEEALLQEQIKGYIGFDPTADSLHVGNLVPVMLLRRLQKAGHIPIVLVGGATGLIGDPSGKSSERNLLSPEQITSNVSAIQSQLARFLDFNSKSNPAQIVNNYDWFQNLSFLDFIRNVGKHISVNYMMAKDSVKNRLETGISFTEFSYQLIQGYDFVHLYRNLGCKLQMGGSDQWGNITTGTELIRRITGGEAFALTAPLLTKSDGSKFGKSEGKNIWLDPNKTSPFQFYQFWLNVADSDAEKLIFIFSDWDFHAIQALVNEHKNEPHLRILQKKLAQIVTTMVHSESEYLNSVKASEVLFGNTSQNELLGLGKNLFLDALNGVPNYSIPIDLLGSDPNITDLLTINAPVFPSKSEARKLIQSGALRLNKEKCTDPQEIVNSNHLIFNNCLLVQKGKKNYFLVTFE